MKKSWVISTIWGVSFLFHFVGVPLYFTSVLFHTEKMMSIYLIIFFVVSQFFTSFWNVFRYHHEYKLLPQILKMIVALYVGIIAFAAYYRFEGVLAPNGVISHEPLDALYFSIVTWTTLGYGDFQPSEVARLWAGVQALMGTLFTPMLLAAIVFSADTRNTSYTIKE